MALEKIGKYEISDLLGRGAMGTVYLAHDPFADRDVAIKLCIFDQDEDPGANRLIRKLFFNEAHTAGALDHPNILRVFDAGEEDGQPYIVMEFVQDAETLKPYVDGDNLLPVRNVVEIVYQCAKALDYAHRRGVVHRDIKSTNIMLTRDGTAKLADFGIAQYAQADQTQVMGMLGSPRYMSPEQAREEDVNHQTDLYSLGVVCYELLTGRAPYVARGFTGLIQKILNEEPISVRELRPEIPEALAATVTKAMAKDTAERYRDAQEMAIDLAGAFHQLGRPPEELSEDSKYESARELEFFASFSDSEVREVVEACAWERFEHGDSIVSEGSLEHAFYVVVSGEVGVSKRGKQIAVLSRGESFGEMGFVARSERSATVTALEQTTLLKINSSLMEQASMTCQLRFNQAFLQTVVARLARTSDDLAQRID